MRFDIFIIVIHIESCWCWGLIIPSSAPASQKQKITNNSRYNTKMEIYIQTPAYNWVVQQDFRPTHKEKYLYFLSLLSTKNKIRCLSSKFLKSSLGKNKTSLSYKSIIVNLINEGIVECDWKIVPGKKSLGYKISNKFFTSQTVEYKLTNQKIINKVQYALMSKFDILPEYLKQMKTNIGDLTCNGIPVIVGNVKVGRTGRVYNMLTNSKRVDRAFMYQNTNTLSELDITAAQPYFFGLLITSHLGILSMDEEMPDDLRNYIDLVVDGTIYEFIANKIGKDISNDSIRSKFKINVFKHYFFNPKFTSMSNTEIGKVFIEYFPTLHKFIVDNYINKNKTLAGELQNFESNFIINNIFKSLVDSDIWAVTLHDAVICKTSDSEYVAYLINSYINSFLFSVPVKIKGIDTFCPTPSTEILKDHLPSISGSSTVLYNLVTFEPESQGVGQNKNDITKDKNRDKIYDTLEIWAFNKNGKVTIRKVAELTDMSKKTIEKHWNSFKMKAHSINIENKNLTITY